MIMAFLVVIAGRVAVKGGNKELTIIGSLCGICLKTWHVAAALVACLVVHDAVEDVRAVCGRHAGVELARALAYTQIPTAAIVGVAVVEFVGRVVDAIAVVSPGIAACSVAVTNAIGAAAEALALGGVVLVGPGAPAAHAVAGTRSLVDARTRVIRLSKSRGYKGEQHEAGACSEHVCKVA